ncbi:MAG: DNA-3-methyladenine glycosylase I [Mariprofundaceae bacterium]
MLSFEVIHNRAANRKGGINELNKLLPELPDREAVAALDESRFLAEMTRCIFQAGFVWRVINNKWPGFEEVFHGFDVNTILGLVPDEWDDICEDTRIVRNRQKIVSVRMNAELIENIALEHGSFARFIADWPESDLVGLLALLKKRGSRLGGNSGQRFLRNVGKDTFVLTRDVVACLRNGGLKINANPASKRDHMAIQQTFNQWHEETELPYTYLSRIAAYSIDSD